MRPSRLLLCLALVFAGTLRAASSTSHSGVFLGQHIEELTITGLPRTFKGRLVLRVGEEEVFRSEPITGRADYTCFRPAR